MPLIVHWAYETTPKRTDLKLLPRLKWKQETVSVYQQRLEENLPSINVMTESTEVIASKIVSCIRNAIDNNDSRKPPNFKQKWFDKECMSARKKSFTLLNALRNSNCNTLKKWYLEANTYYKKLCLRKKTEFENHQACSLGQIKSSKEFWKTVREINGSSFEIGIGLSAEDISEHFKSLLYNNSDVRFSYAEPMILDEILDSEISLAEIRTVIFKGKNGKAPGEDEIPYEFFKNGTVALHLQLKALFNKIISGEKSPLSFKRSVIFPIHKKGDLNIVENYRGISFMNVLAKLFCGVLVNRLETWVNTYNILSDYQAGFRKTFSTVDHIFSLTSIIRAFQARNKKVYAFFVDFKAAFDLINRNALFYKLSQLGLSSKFINIIKDLYTESKAAVWDGTIYSEWFETNSGVKQGCLLSALLFALFINDVVTCLPGGIRIFDLNINVLLYADDLVVLSASPESLQLMINRLAEYCLKWNLVINSDKPKVMVFSRSARCRNTSNWFFNGTKLEVTNEYKYLGVKLNSTLDFTKHLSDKSKSAQSLINVSWRNIFLNERIDLSSKYKIFDAVVKSTLCYAAQVWGIDEYEDIEKFQRNFIKKLFNLPLKTPNYALYLETGLPKLFTYTLKLQADYIVKILSHQDVRLSKKMVLYEFRNEDWWMSKWKSLGNNYGEVVSSDPGNFYALKEQLYRIIQKHENYVRDSFKTKARVSESRILYSKLNTTLLQNNYFHDLLNFKEISFIFKVRCELLSLNGSPYNGSFNQFCSLCNLKSKEDCFHFVSICPILSPQRLSYFGKRTLTLQETINILNGCDWNSLCKFLKDAYKYRMLLITEFV